jgi:uncharacterized protein (UPF0332 family)
LNPSDNLVLARFLASSPRGVPEEASHRGACGRAYYATFAIARDLLLVAGFRIPSDSDAHSLVVHLLRRSANPAVRFLATGLKNLRALRNEADYDVGLRASPSANFDATRTRLAVAAAITIVDELRRVEREDRRLRIPPGIN